MMDRSGYIYIIKADTGHYKIGRTKNVPKRLNFFGVRLPFAIELCWSIKVDDMYRFESWLHRYFKNERVNGEWFNISDFDLDIFGGFKTQQDVEQYYDLMEDVHKRHNLPYAIL